MKRYINTRVILIAIVILSASVITWALDQKIKKNTVKPVPVTVKAKVYDTVLLAKFDQLLQTLDFSKNTFCFEGKYNVVDGTDTTNNVRDLKFLFCRAGNNFYSKLGNTETINQNGINVYVQHDMRKIVVSQMSYQSKSPITGIRQMVKTLRSENYDLVSSETGSERKISLINEHHITCKEISATYDTAKNTLKTVLIRFTDISDPGNDKKDRTIQIDLTRMDNTAKMNNYPAISAFVREERGKLALMPKFSSYELIKL